MNSAPKLMLVTLMILPLLAFGQAKQQSPANVEQQLTKLENDWMNFTLKRDVASLDRLLADDLTSITPEGKLNTKAQELADVKSGDYAPTAATNKDMKVRVFGNTAIVTGVTAIKGKAKGQDISGDYRFTDTWVLRDGRWQCVATQGSKIAAAK
jgi:ketosteroid isomerase-like protein